MDRQFGICNLSVAPMRAEPADKSEIKTQLLFGDRFEVLELREKWARILTLYDDYEAWIDPKQFAPISANEFALPETKIVSGFTIDQYVIKQSTQERIYLSPGCSIPLLVDNVFYIGKESYHYFGEVINTELAVFQNEIEHKAKFFLHAPYLWGGKTWFGIDCSGLTQVVYKTLNIQLKRDAIQQGSQGKTVDFLQGAETGDLAFFDNDEGRIIHVGIMIGNSKIIHASGRVKIDSIDNQGIYSEEMKRYTHKLRIIKRFVST